MQYSVDIFFYFAVPRFAILAIDEESSRSAEMERRCKIGSLKWLSKIRASCHWEKMIAGAKELLIHQQFWKQKEANGLAYERQVNFIKVLETFIRGKAGADACEDAYHLSEHFAAVIDGVTSKSAYRKDGKSTGKLAAELVQEVIAKLPPDSTAEAFVLAVNNVFDAFYRENHFPDDPVEKGLQAVCIIYSAFRREIWMIGDCQAMVDGCIYQNPKKSDEIIAELRALDMACLKKKQPELSRMERMQEAREAIVPWILKATCFANDAASPYGYSVLNGRPVPKALIKIIPLNDNAHEVILASDGYPILKQSLAETEDALTKLLQEDPACYKAYHTTKGVSQGWESFDDRTYLHVSIEKK